MEIYKNDSADVILSSSIRNYKQLAENLSTTKLFDSVYTQDLNLINFTKLQKVFLNLIDIKDLNLSEDIIKKNYDRYFVCYPNQVKGLLYNLLKKKNKNLELYAYEDGLSTYSHLYENRFYVVNKKKGLRALLLHENKFYFKGLKAVYVFEPKYFTWTKNKCIKIPKITENDTQYINVVNATFNYENDGVKIKEKVIFFEESYNSDGKPVDDMPIINHLISEYGAENVLIKHHPRADYNRLESLGLNIMPSSHIPWEIYIMNNYKELKNVLLVSIASGCIFSPYIMFDMKFNCMACFNLFDKKDLYADIYDVYSKIAKENNVKMFEFNNKG